MNNRRIENRGFTLIEILVVIGMIAILASVVLVAINPARQFAQARNAQRVSNVNAILNAIGDRMAEHKGQFAEPEGQCIVPLPQTPSLMSFTSYNIRPCLVPTYISEVPLDPTSGANSCTSLNCTGSGEDYSTGYTVAQDSSTGRVTVCAPGYAESALGLDQPYCLTR